MSDETTNELNKTDETVADEQVDEAAAVAEAAEAAEDAGAADEPETAAEPEAAEPETAAEPEAEGEPAASADEPAAPAAAPAAKKKRKRLPRAERPQKTRRKHVPSPTRKPIVRLDKPDAERGRRQERQGTVVSDAMDKTIVVKVDMIKAHPRYKKVVRRSTKFHAHDELNVAKAGDIVRIIETRPLSKSKRWRLAEVLEAAK
jgi:small subunit ribosomal protein S17